MLQYIALAAPLVGGFAVSSTVSTDSYKQEAPGNPPRWVFPVAWSILYVLIGVVGYRLARRRNVRGLFLWIVGLILNFSWTPLYFGTGDREGALTVLRALIFVTSITTILLYRDDPVAGHMFLPYLAWLVYAHTLSDRP